MIHGHELRVGGCWAGGARQRGDKREKHWDTCDSIINKIYLKKKKTEKSEQRTTYCCSSPRLLKKVQQYRTNVFADNLLRDFSFQTYLSRVNQALGGLVGNFIGSSSSQIKEE